MHQKKIIVILFLFVSGLAYCQQRPNIIFILADDLGRSDLPVYGNRFNEAPNIKAMAKRGVLYTNAYAAAPVCSPTRASIQSGQYPARVGIMDFIPGFWRPYEAVIVPQNRTQYMPAEIITIGEVMKQAGYRTGYFGKWDLADSAIHDASAQGYDETHVGIGHFNVRFNPPYPDSKGLHGSEALARMSESFIERNRQHPFFLFVSPYDVHSPLDADSALIVKYLKKPKVAGYTCNPIYAAMIEHLDNLVGRILKKVSDAGLDDNTLIVFFSDNGGMDQNFVKGALPAPAKRHFLDGDSLMFYATVNTPFRGVKGNLYEGGIREPLIIKYPRDLKGGTQVSDVVTSVDFFPSFVSLAGAAMPSSQTFDGINIFSGHVPYERPIFWHYPFYHHGVPASVVRMGDWKLIRNLADHSYELYDLKKDEGETNNLAALQPERVAKMAAVLDEWLKDVNAPMPQPNPGFDKDKRLKWGRHPARK